MNVLQIIKQPDGFDPNIKKECQFPASRDQWKKYSIPWREYQYTTPFDPHIRWHIKEELDPQLI